jgi:prepilin signal peptidase PulO-like enzyme (type II secretory pathway)
MTSKSHWIVALLFPLVVGPIWCLTFRDHIGWLGTLAGFVLFSTLIASAITDFKYNRIYNWATYSAFLWAVAINIIATASARFDEITPPSAESANVIGLRSLGGIGIGFCLAGAAVCFIITLFAYDLSARGAADVKLATVIGAFLGFYGGIFAIAYSYIIAAILIIAWSTWKNGPLAIAKAGFRKVGRLFGRFWPFPLTAEDEKLLTTYIPIGPSFAIGTLLVALQVLPT